MSTMVATLLARPRRVSLLGDLGRGEAGALPSLVAVTVAGAAVYGLVLGSWRGGWMIPATAVKLPLVLVGTALLTMPLNWILALLGGARLGGTAATALSFFALAQAALVLASLAPVAWLFTIAAPGPGLDARTAHNLLYLLHTGLVALAGLAGASGLRRAFSQVTGDDRQARRITRAWIVAFALMGGEVAWVLRPFVGSIYLPVTFLRPDALDGNVYEFLITDILPYVFGG